MRYLLVLPALMLSGCFFAVVPLQGDGGPDADQKWNTCVEPKAYIGYRLKNDDGRIGTVAAIFGRSSRCQVDSHPLLASVTYE